MPRVSNKIPTHQVTAPAAVEIPQDPMLLQKVASLSLGTNLSATVNWKNNRIATPGNLVLVKDEHKNKELTTKTETAAATVFTHPSGKAQGLFLVEGHMGACTVSTDILNPANRADEKYKTYIQFDKTTIDDEDADFKAPPKKKGGKKDAFYDGCHLIDYQFITGDAHYDKNNYFPGNYFYNRHIRNFLVDDPTTAYVEIPAYTPTPPLIKAVRAGKEDYAIPACIFFIQISPSARNQKSKVTIYCFPNNSYDYEDTKTYLNIKKGKLSATVAPHFELNRALYPLLKPAIIHTLRTKQLDKEEEMAEILQDLLQFEENEGALSLLGSQVIGKKVDPTLILPNCASVCNDSLKEALGFAGDFLIQHALRNILKAETFSIKARLSFISAIIKCIEAAPIISDEEYEFFHTFEEELKSTFDELLSSKKTLEVDDLLLLSSTYFRMTSSFTLPYAYQDGVLLSEDEFENYYKDGIQVLKELVTREPRNFEKEQMKAFLATLVDADQTLALLDNMQQGEEYAKEGKFLYKCRPLGLRLLKTLQKDDLFPDWWKESMESLGFEPEWFEE